MDLARFDFDPSAGTVIRTPPGRGYGFWVGGHKVSFDERSGTFALFYRERAPLEFGGGGACAVAVSEDGITFREVWRATKDQMNAASIEVGHPVPTDDGWRLYVSYEIAGTATWHIDMIEAAGLDALSAQGRRTVLAPGDYGLAWIKDPVVYHRDGRWHVYAAVPPRTGSVRRDAVVAAGPLDATVLAVSEDGLVFPEIEYVFEAPVDGTWHGNRARINSVFPNEDGFVATFDGGRTSYDDYEELPGLATSPDGRRFTREVGDSPWLASPYGTVRYVFGLPVGSSHFFYYEYTREDGSHDLRVATV